MSRSPVNVLKLPVELPQICMDGGVLTAGLRILVPGGKEFADMVPGSIKDSERYSEWTWGDGRRFVGVELDVQPTNGNHKKDSDVDGGGYIPIPEELVAQTENLSANDLVLMLKAEVATPGYDWWLIPCRVPTERIRMSAETNPRLQIEQYEQDFRANGFFTLDEDQPLTKGGARCYDIPLHIRLSESRFFFFLHIAGDPTSADLQVQVQRLDVSRGKKGYKIKREIVFKDGGTVESICLKAENNRQTGPVVSKLRIRFLLKFLRSMVQDTVNKEQAESEKNN